MTFDFFGSSGIGWIVFTGIAIACTINAVRLSIIFYKTRRSLRIIESMEDQRMFEEDPDPEKTYLQRIGLEGD